MSNQSKKKKNPGQLPPRQPQDHQAPIKPFEFSIGEGETAKTYTLPRVDSSIVNKIPGEIVEAALLDGEEGQAKMAFALLRAVPKHDEAKAALRQLPFAEMLTHLLRWLEASGATPGKSQG